ncbi:MAG TPA: alpha/beta hydrolase [Thiobacillaceae bacterium]|nr:alpha/beta hydrolase [Thiobacillaceae bacterium]
MPPIVRLLFLFPLLLLAAPSFSEINPGIVDIPTRPGVTQRILVVPAKAPTAAVILFAGGHGGLQLSPDGSFGWGKGNFLVRSRQLFADQGLLSIVVDAPSDRQSPPFLAGFRQTGRHVQDIQAVIAWVRAQAQVPVWLVGTSRGTQSAAYIATELASPEGPDGLVLTSSILTDSKSTAVPALPLDRVSIPVLVVHHELDGCGHCAFGDVPSLMDGLSRAPRKGLLTYRSGESRGDPCEAMAYHGFNGIEPAVVADIAAWIRGR